MKFWIDNFDIDGYRCDMAHLVPLDFWKYARTVLDKEKKLFWLAETEEINYHEAFDASYTWQFLHKMEAYWKRETDINGLIDVLKHYNDSFPKHALRMFFTSNHDENSHSSSEYERMGQAAKAFAVFCATWNGIPLIYSGQELPNSRRLKFFDKDLIQWTGSFELHIFYKTLLDLHTYHPALSAGDDRVTTFLIPTSNEKVFSYLRKAGEREVLVILNLSGEEISLQLRDEKVSGNYKNVFTNEYESLTGKNFTMKPWDHLVYEK